MNTQEFLDFGKAAVDFVANYTDTIRDRKVLPEVEPGFLSKMLPEDAPQDGEKWQEVLKDVEKYIVPGMTHWVSPNFHAFFPTGNSFPSIVGEMISAGFSCIGFSWLASPVCTELEVVTMNWLGKLLGLPSEFLNSSEGPGGGVIQGSASESALVCLLAAKERTVRRIQTLHPDWDEGFIKSKLVAYSSDQSNSCIEKSGILASVPMRLLPADDQCVFRGETLRKAIEEDIEKGFIPCYAVATLGTTGTCAFDNLAEIGPVCKEYDIWLHIDAAYGGAAFVCPEYRHLMAGIEYVESFSLNPHKWLLVNFDCAALWVRDSRCLLEAFNIERIYLSHEKEGVAPEYRHWQIPLGRRFRALKLWFVLRIYGAKGLQEHIRSGIRFAEMFQKYITSDDRFELVFKRSMGLICFRMKGEDELTKNLLSRLTERKNIYVVAATYRENVIIRFVICSRLTEERDLAYAWKEISEQADEVLKARVTAVQDELKNMSVKPKANMVNAIEDTNHKTKTDIHSIS